MILNVSDASGDTQKISASEIPVGMHSHNSQGLAFPHFVWVLSTMLPAMRSVMPSKHFEIRNIVPTAPAAIPTLSV